jgi:hypothetical protein
MQPNDLPIVCLPMELSDEAAAQLLDFLYVLTEALERHYGGQLLRYAHDQRAEAILVDPQEPTVDGHDDDPPF